MPTLKQAAAPHPDLLPASGEKGNVVRTAALRDKPKWSPLQLPCRDGFAGCRILPVLELDAHRCEFIADAVTFRPILRLSGGEAGFN